MRTAAVQPDSGLPEPLGVYRSFDDHGAGFRKVREIDVGVFQSHEQGDLQSIGPL